MLNPTQFKDKEEKVEAVDDSLSEVDPLSEASSLLSGWETLEEDKSEILWSVWFKGKIFLKLT